MQVQHPKWYLSGRRVRDAAKVRERRSLVRVRRVLGSTFLSPKMGAGWHAWGMEVVVHTFGAGDTFCHGRAWLKMADSQGFDMEEQHFRHVS